MSDEVKTEEETLEVWWYSDVTLENSYGESITMKVSQWYAATLHEDGINQALYGMDTLDIIDELIDVAPEGIFDEINPDILELIEELRELDRYA
jgi:hypothetical protein